MGKRSSTQTDVDEKMSDSDQSWMKYMEFGYRLGCHQKPERSFFIKGYQMPICARCVGVYIGYLLAIPSYLIFGFHNLKVLALLGCDGMLLDWVLQAYKVKESTNRRRLVTGILGGFGIMVIFLRLIGKLITGMVLVIRSNK